MIDRMKTGLLAAVFTLWAGTLAAAGSAGGYNPADGLPKGYSEAGTRTAEFLTIPVGARGVALGGAFGALADDVSALWWNPAGAAFIGEPQVLLNVIDQPLDVSYTYVAGASPFLDGRLVLGAFMGVLSSGDQEITTVTQPEGTGATFGSYSLQGGGTLAWNFSDRFSAGFNLKAVHEDIAGNTQSTFAFDLGTNYHASLAGRDIRLAFLIRNLGGNMAFGGNSMTIRVPAEDIYPGSQIGRQERKALRQATRFKLPTSFHVSLGCVLMSGENYTWAGAAEFSQNSDMPVSYHLGSELGRSLGKTGVALRGGWEFRGDETGLSGADRLRGLSAGGGVSYDFLLFRGAIDYAWRDWGRLSSSHLFSLGILF